MELAQRTEQLLVVQVIRTGVINALLYGAVERTPESRFDLESTTQATLTYTDGYGLRCTGAATLFETGRYTVMVCLDETLQSTFRLT